MSQDANTILQAQLKQQGLHTTRPQFTNILYGTVLQTDISIASILPVGATSPIPAGMMTVAIAALGSNYVTEPILYPNGFAPPVGAIVSIGFTPNGTPIAITAYTPITARRVLSITSNVGAPTFNTNLWDQVDITAQSVGLTFTFGTNVTGTPKPDQFLVITITGTTSVPITWGTGFQSSGGTVLPITTTGTITKFVGLQWNAHASAWICIALS